MTAREDGDDKQTADDAEDADGDTDVAVVATVLVRKSHQQTLSLERRRTVALRLYFRFPRDFRIRRRHAGRQCQANRREEQTTRRL